MGHVAAASEDNEAAFGGFLPDEAAATVLPVCVEAAGSQAEVNGCVSLHVAM